MNNEPPKKNEKNINNMEFQKNININIVKTIDGDDLPSKNSKMELNNNQNILNSKV